MDIGPVLHKLRKERKMTLIDLSEKCGIAIATLSRMENGKMMGTLKSHISICRALQVQLPDFYRDMVAAGQKVEVQAQDTRSDVFVHDNRAMSELLTSNPLNKKMMPTMVRISKGGGTHLEETKVGIEKFVYILDGKVEAAVGKEKFNLVKGDTLYFESSIPHLFKNTGPSEARLISVVSPPAL